MIRRVIQFPDGAAGWVLISQIEHARISGQLAAHCLGRFTANELADVRRELLTAIACHDDGWADWERSPRLDATLARPVSFMELEVAEALDVWTKSITAAEQQGPLAAWMVTGHFSRLLENSDHARHDPLAATWLGEMRQRREKWLADWRARNPAVRTRGVAEEALQWLWAFDEVSLWFCCHCPVGGERRPNAPQQSRVGRGTPIEMELFASGARVGAAKSRGAAGATPWRFDVALIDIEAAGCIVPVRRYENSQALLAAAEPHTLRWRLTRTRAVRKVSSRG
jgi:hypothetical protein